MTELHKSIYDIAPSVASVIARRFRGYVERDDVLQECLAWALTRSKQFDEMLNEPNAVQRVIYEKRIGWQMKRANLLECAVSTADRRCTSALRKVQNGLGGDNPWQ
jgi:hypothetical protein